MSETGDPALIGRRVAGKFRIDKFLGGGAMGAVYRAHDGSLERNVALKVMHPAVAVDPSFVSRFHREARAASRLDHPNSMRVIEFGEEPDGLLYIAMEYLEGRDLYKVIHEDWPIPETRIADMMMKALSAAAVAHEMGVIHRDLKPENIMILNRKDDEGQDIVKVCDFGIAKITEADDEPGAAPKTAGAKLTTAGLVVGTPEYMSPEQARGEKLDQRSDLYSMGIILYQLLTGRTPFLADTALAVVLKHITEPPEPPATIYPGVHKGLEAVCMRALKKAREERFQSARDMRSAVKAAIEGRPIPIDTNASTAVDPMSADDIAAAARHGTGPVTGPSPQVGTAAMSTPTHAQTSSSSGAPAAFHPSTSKVTPLGTAMASFDDKKKSRAPLIAGVAFVALLVGGGGLFLAKNPQLLRGGGGKAIAVTANATESKPPEAPNENPKSKHNSNNNNNNSNSTPSATITSDSTATAPNNNNANPPDPRKHPPKLNATSATDPKPSTQPTTAPTPEPPTPDPPAPPPPAPTPTQTQAPPPPTPPPPAPVAFNPQTCKASLGAKRAVNGSVKDLGLNADAAWTACAKKMTEKPAGPLAASVNIRFNENRAFKGAKCSGSCPAPVAACIANTTARTATLTLKSGDVTGEPEFEVPVTFTCD